MEHTPPQNPQPEQSPDEVVHIPSTAELEDSLNQLDSEVEALSARQAQIEGKLGRLAVADSIRDRELLDAAEVVGSRRITDPNKPAHKTELSVAPETASSKRTLGAFIGKLVTPSSVHTSNSETLKSSADRSPSTSQKSKKEVRAELRSAKRLNDQKLRQGRTKDAEVTFGGGIGLGQQAKVRTLFSRLEQSKALREDYTSAPLNASEYESAQQEFENRYQELLERYDSGELTDEQFVALNRADNLEFKAITDKHKSGPMSGAEYLKAKNAISKSVVTVPTKEVRRNMRRERAGATYTITRAKSPISSKINKFKTKRQNRKLDKTNNELTVQADRRAEIEDELRRRSEED